MNNLIYASLIISLLSSATPYIIHTNYNPTVNKLSTYNLKNKVSIDSKELKNKTDYLDSKLKFPVLNALQSKIISQTINSSIKKDILDFRDRINNLAIKNKENSIKDGYSLIPYVAYTDFKVFTLNNDFISFYIDFYEFTGGAHGTTLRKSYNIDLKTGKFLTLNDILKEIPNYKNKINRYVYNEISKKPDIYFSDAFKGINNDIAFTIEKNTLTLYFQQYEIAPYSSGIPEFKIPFFKLSNF